MSWDTEFVLDGLWTFGEPLNIWEMELYKSPPGYGELPYQRLHMRIDNSKIIFDRIMGQINKELPFLTFINTKAKKEIRLNRPDIYSLERNYMPTNYTSRGYWEGITLGLRFDRGKSNNAAMDKLLGGGRRYIAR